jgi:hypothetical protein
LLCVSCRGRLSAEKRARFLSARAVVLESANDRGLLRGTRRGGRWSEKLITLTTPHFSGESVAARIARVLKAWRTVLKSLNAWLRDTGAHASSAWFRVFEWTSGNDGRGHPHLHVWFFGPYIEQAQLRGWWATALNVPDAIVDVREVRDSNGAAQELIKYLTKDIDANGDKIAPSLYAEVYKALDGARLTQSSSGFIGLARREPAACECGVALPRRVRRARKPESMPAEAEPEVTS